MALYEKKKSWKKSPKTVANPVIIEPLSIGRGGGHTHSHVAPVRTSVVTVSFDFACAFHRALNGRTHGKFSCLEINEMILHKS